MKQNQDPEGGLTDQKEPDGFRNPLPAGSQDCSLGPAKDWPETLQQFSRTVASFSYPAAIYYGEALTILHNEAWADVAGVEQQGQEQRGRLSADAWEALSAALRGGKPKSVDGTQLIGTGGAERDVTSNTFRPVLVSPVFDRQENGGVVGLLAQLVPQDLPRNWSAKLNGAEKIEHTLEEKMRPVDISELGTASTEFPLDEHPFFYRFAELLPSGLAILDHRAQAVFVNQLFYQLTTHHDSNKAFKSWPQSIHPEDYDRVMTAYQDAFQSQKQLRTEFRAIEEHNPWRLLLLTPLGDESLRHVSLREYGGFICSIVDISSEKSAELAERNEAKKATERKEQQERFIDMISHEIRNPLSAILHCTEDIEDAIKSPHSQIDKDAVLEATETIQLCISHQRNIVDDVLSFSKLDASMLSLNPKSTQPSDKLASSLKMFGPEFRKQQMEFEFCIDPSYVDAGVEWVMADMARIGQVVVNLVSNAVKFTAKKQGEKKIVVSVGASQERPTSYPPNVVYFNSDDMTHRLDATNTTAWGNGQALWIMCAVNDTGIGISEDGQRRLFERFRQATPKTAELYGGSGLGLNISRKMCHLHGGEIGVSSKEGSGSTFGFFFRVKRSEGPEVGQRQEAEDQATESEQLKSQARALGRITGTPAEDDAYAPESIKSPPIARADEAHPYPDGSKDERYQQTVAVAADVKEIHAKDILPNPSRPKIMQEQYQSGSYVHSAHSAKNTTEHDDHEPPPPPPNHDKENTLPTTSPAGQKPHVLLVEDNVINQRIVARRLSAKGFAITTANNGREAVDAVRHSGAGAAFTIALMDQEMPELDGNSATREIRALEREGVVRRVPILGLTANVRGAQLQGMLDSGMDDVISKPYKIEDLVEKIRRITEGKGEVGEAKG